MRKIVFILSVAAICVSSISVSANAGSDKDTRAQEAKTDVPYLHSLTPAPEPLIVPVFNTYDAFMVESFEMDHSHMTAPSVQPVAYSSALHKAEYQVPDKYGNRCVLNV